MKSMRQSFTHGLEALYKQYKRFCDMKQEIDIHNNDARARAEEAMMGVFGLAGDPSNQIANDNRRANETQVAYQAYSTEIMKGRAQQDMLRGYDDVVVNNLKAAEGHFNDGLRLACSTIERYIHQQGIAIPKKDALEVARSGKELAILGGNGALYNFGIHDWNIQFVPVEPAIPVHRTYSGASIGWQCFENEHQVDDGLVPADFFASATSRGYTVLRKNHAQRLRRLMAEATPWPQDEADQTGTLMRLDGASEENEEMEIELADMDSPIVSLMP